MAQARLRGLNEVDPGDISGLGVLDHLDWV